MTREDARAFAPGAFYLGSRRVFRVATACNRWTNEFHVDYVEPAAEMVSMAIGTLSVARGCRVSSCSTALPPGL